MNVTHINVVACVGAGIIGASWATLFAQKGYRVNLYDVAHEIVHSALDAIKGNYALLCGSTTL